MLLSLNNTDDFSLILREFNISCDEILNDCNMVSFMMEETQNGEKPKGIIGFIGSIINKIIQIIKDFVEMVGNIFNLNDNVTAKDYLRSDTFNDKFNSDFEQKEAIVKKKMAEGNALIQKISSVTGIDDVTVMEFTNGAGKALAAVIPLAIAAAPAFLVSKKVAPIFQNHQRELEKAHKNAKKIREQKRQEQAMKIVKTMKDMYSDLMSSGNKLFGWLKTKKKGSTGGSK